MIRLSSLGCWQPAAILLKRLSEKHGNSAEVWHNLALCHAWDGNEPAAAEAFHKAGELYKDEEAAVECEALAQLLDLELTEEVNEIVLNSYKVESVSKLLTELDKVEQFDRLSIEVPLDGDGPIAQYRLLEKPFPSEKKPEDLNPEDIPEFVADILVFDATDEQSAQLQITGVEGEGFEQADETLRDAVGSLISLDEEADDEPLGVVPTELEGLEWNCHFPADFPATIARNIETRKMQTVAKDIWPNLKLSGLKGKTPREAQGDESLRVPLKASLFVLDAFYDRNNVMLDIDALRANLGVDAPAALSPDDANVTGFSTVALQRISFKDLTDEQLVDIARRVLLVRHTRTAFDALSEVANRPECVQRVGAERVYSTLVGICREQNRREDALKWLADGRDAAEAADEAFRNILEWDVRELNLRLDDPADPQIPVLWKKFEQQYFPKLPEIRDSMAVFMEEKGLGHLLSETVSVPTDDDDVVWTPDSGEAKDGGKKLWVPGQD